MTAPRLTLTDPLGMAEPPRPEIAEALRIHDRRTLVAALDRIQPDAMPFLLAEVLAERFGPARARRIAALAAEFVEGPG